MSECVDERERDNSSQSAVRFELNFCISVIFLQFCCNDEPYYLFCDIVNVTIFVWYEERTMNYYKVC